MIGLFNDCFPPIMDGVSLTTQNYAYWLHQKTHNVCVVTPKSPEAKDEGEYPVYRYSSIPIPMRKPYRLGFPRIDWPFHERINRLSFELVHAHCPFSSGALAMQIACTQKVPIVATFHSKYRADFERAISSKLLVDILMKKVIRFYEAADEVWIPQAAVEETLREYGYKGKVEVVDNGNDFVVGDSFPALRTRKREQLGLRRHELMLLFVGQHIWEKNLDFLLHALSLVKDLPFKMFFVGSGYASEELKRMAATLSLSDKVVFVGSIIQRDALKEYYAAADLFLFPSLYDNAPLVVREAAAMHTPSVLIKGSTSAEIVSDSYNGFLSENTVDDFAARLRTLFAAPQLIKQAGEQAATSIVRSWEDVAGEVYDRYTSLMNRTVKK
ncbi:glycosyltransferase [uncultured Bacteroides sp.]|uniref:glycosyltransferase n=1 Tax=uncultured Bacteroides sp. TaxID=162156 RepID=UPI002AA92F50|nr:glycosyltransferase [uncultured Bacteroides sp.]